MKFTRFLAIFLIVGGGLALWLSFRQQQQHYELPPGIKAQTGASVVVVTLDTTRKDRLGCYGSPADATPFMDSLAEAGVVFENAQAVTPITLPSHTSIFTGLYPQTHGVRNNGMFTVPEHVETLAEVFSDAGYATGAFISAEVLNHKYGLDKGFDTFDDDLTQARKIGKSMVPTRRGDLTLGNALEWLDGIEPETPVFLWLHLYDPHAPYDPPPEFREKFPADLYTGEIAFTDSLVEKLVGALEASGRFDETILTIVADHGEGLGEHGERTHGMLLHEATIHVPWILVTPNEETRGLRIRQAVSNADVAPTLAALTGVAPPNASWSDGRVVVDTNALALERDIYFEAMLPMYQYGWSPLRGLRTGAWKLVSGRRDELFHLGNDPRELTDVATSEELQATHLRNKILAIAEADTTLAHNPAIEMRPGEREALEALGYVVNTSAERRNPPDPRDLVAGHVAVEIARDLLGAGRFDEALAKLDLMLQSDPENLSALNLKGNALFQANKTEDAEQTFLRVLELDPQSSDAVASLCRLEMARNEFEKAIELARFGRDTRSPFHIFDALEARCLVALDRQKEAARLVEEALKDSPDDPDLLVFQASMRIAEGELDKAEDDLRRAINVTPFHGRARQVLGNLLGSMGRTDEAIEVYEQLLKINPGEVNALLNIGTILLETDPASAIPYLEEAARLAPGKEVPLGTLGIAYLRIGRINEAETAMERALAVNPENRMLRNNLGILLSHQGRSEEAIVHYETLIAQHPGFVEAYNNAAIAYAEADRLNQAESMVRKAIDLNPEYLDGWLTLATILHRLNRTAEEYETLSRAWELSLERPDVGMRLALAAATTGNCRTTLSIMESVSSGIVPPLDVELAWASCLEKTGKTKEAMRHYEEVARRSPRGPIRKEATAAIQRLSLNVEE